MVVYYRLLQHLLFKYNPIFHVSFVMCQKSGRGRLYKGKDKTLINIIRQQIDFVRVDTSSTVAHALPTDH